MEPFAYEEYRRNRIKEKIQQRSVNRAKMKVKTLSVSCGGLGRYGYLGELPWLPQVDCHGYRGLIAMVAPDTGTSILTFYLNVLLI